MTIALRDGMMDYSSKLLIVVLLIIAAGTTTDAKTYEFPVHGGSQVFACRVSYDLLLAYAGNDHLQVNVSVDTRGPADLESIDLQYSDPEKIYIKPHGKPFSTTSETGLRTTEYKFLANIRPGVEPKDHDVLIIFRYPNQKPIEEHLPFLVGVRNNGKLNVITNGQITPEFCAGADNTYDIEFLNNFQNYSARIRSITVKSDPLGLVQSTIVEPKDLTIKPLQRATLPVNLKTAPISFSNLLNGFSDSSHLVLQIAYDDGNGREITDLVQQVKIRVKPSSTTMVLAMIIGALIGAAVKCYREKNGILKLDTLWAVGIGVAVAFVAIVAKIKIVAFEISGGYDNPAMLGIIGFVAAFGGLPILLSILSKYSNQASAPAAPPATSVNSPAPKPVA